METFVVDKNSWHYKLVREYVTDKYPYDLREKAMPKDFCSYWRRVVIEAVKIAVLVSVSIPALVAVVVFLGYMIYAIFFDFSGFGLPSLIFFVIIAAVVSIMAAPHIIRERKIVKQLRLLRIQ